MKSAVVTGAGQGVGPAIARRLADRGHTVILNDLDGDAATQAVSDVGRNAVGIHQDVRVAISQRARRSTGDLDGVAKAEGYPTWHFRTSRRARP